MFDLLTGLPSLLSLFLFAPLFGLVNTQPGEEIAVRSVLDGTQEIALPQDRFEKIELEFDLENQTGEDVGPSDLGELLVLRDGDKQYQTWDSLREQFDFVKEMTEYQTTEDRTSGGSSTLRTEVFQSLPLVAPTNAFHVPEDEESALKLKFRSSPGGNGYLNGLLSSGVVRVIGYQNDALAEQKSLRVDRTSPDIGGSGKTQQISNLDATDVQFVFINDPDGVLSEIKLTRLMPGSMADEIMWDWAPIARVDRAFSKLNRDFGVTDLHGLFIPATPATPDTTNEGIQMRLNTTGASSKLEIYSVWFDDARASGSTQAPKSRARKLKNA